MANKTRHSELWENVKQQVELGDVEETISAIAKWMEYEASTIAHPTCKALCETATDLLREAAFNFYASTK